MPTEYDTEIGRALLQKAHIAGARGIEAIAHVEGVGTLHVREVKPDVDGAPIASVRCWSTHESRSGIWLIPLAAVRAIELENDWGDAIGDT
jgi:hypothetical protein